MTSRVLLAEDSAINRKMIRLALHEEGIEVIVAANGYRAVQLLKEASPDLVLASASLAGVSGYELCEYIKADDERGHLPVVILTSAFRPFEETEIIRVRADARLAMPVESRLLIKQVRALLENSKRVEGPRIISDAPQNKPIPRPAASAGAERRALPASIAPAASRSLKQEPSADHALLPNPGDGKPHERTGEGAFLVVWAVMACVILIVLGLLLRGSLGDMSTPPSPQLSAAESTYGEPSSATSPGDAAQASATEQAGHRSVKGQKPPDDGATETARPTGAVNKAPEYRIGQARFSPARSQLFPALTSPGADNLVRGRMAKRAREFEDMGMMEQAEQQYRLVLARFPEDLAARLAVNRLQASLSARKRSQDARARREAGLKEFRSGNYAGAVAELSAAVKAGQADTAVLYALGMSNLKIGRQSEAISSFERCLAANPSYAPAMVGLALASSGAGKNERAVLLLTRALELGGGAEFTPERIRDIIARLSSRSTKQR